MYHRSRFTPDGTTPRTFGPLGRLDPHTPAEPALDPTGRSILYVGANLQTSACEVFGATGEALLCPAWRVARLRPTHPRLLFDLASPGAAMAIGALPSLADGDYPRQLTQQWARAIYEDDPVGPHLDGIRYRSAYNGDLALALWDSAGTVAELAAADGIAQDLPLVYPDVFRRLVVAMQSRRIVVTMISSGRCPRCKQDRSSP